MKSQSFSQQNRIRGPWRGYLDELEPIRPQLHAYCCKLTGNVWDAEDLIQDALLKVFGQLGKTDSRIENPKAYLIRTATNLWIDRMRTEQVARNHADIQLDDTADHQPQQETHMEAQEAALILLNIPSTKERAAVLLKDVLGYSAPEIASMLQTSHGAVKSALHRGRASLAEATPQTPPAASREIVEKFMQALSANDIESLMSLCLPELSGEMVGGHVMNNMEEAKTFFAHAHMEMPLLGFGRSPHWKLHEYLGEPIIIGFRTLDGVEGVNEIHRLQVSEDKIIRIRCYCFCPDTIRFVAQELGLNPLPRPYRSPSVSSVLKSLPRMIFGKRNTK